MDDLHDSLFFMGIYILDCMHKTIFQFGKIHIMWLVHSPKFMVGYLQELHAGKVIGGAIYLQRPTELEGKNNQRENGQSPSHTLFL